MPNTTYKPSPTDPMWDDGDISEYMKVSKVTVRRLRRKGLLPTVKVGAAARTPRSAVLAYVARQMSGGAA